MGLGVLVGLAALFTLGVLGGAVGFLGGATAARRAQPVLVAAVVALLASAALTLFEQPLSAARIYNFPTDHHLAEIAAAIAAVLLFAGLVGIVAWPDRATWPRVPSRQRVEDVKADRRMLGRLPNSTIAAALVAVLFASLSLLQLGDQRWGRVGIAVAIAVLVVAAFLAITWSRRVDAG